MTENEIIVMWSHATSWIIYAKKCQSGTPQLLAYFFHLFFVNVHLKISNIWRHYNDLAQESYDKETK